MASQNPIICLGHVHYQKLDHLDGDPCPGSYSEGQGYRADDRGLMAHKSYQSNGLLLQIVALDPYLGESAQRQDVAEASIVDK